MHADVRAHRDWLLSHVALPNGGTIVDLGSGGGDDLLSLAALIADPSARFLGIDAAKSAVETAVSRAGSDARLSFVQRRLGAEIPLADASIDAVYSNNLLECLGDTAAFAREVGRILRPGGVAVIGHWDFDSQVFNATDRPAVRRLIHAFADWKQPWMDHADGWMGRQLWGIFAASGLFQNSIHARVLTNTIYAAPWFGHARVQDLDRMAERGLVSVSDFRSFARDLEGLSQAGRYFYSITGYAYVGVRLGSA